MELEAVRRVYNAYSKVYDALFKRFFYPRIRHAVTSMDIKPGERILDVGVGTGLSLPLYPEHCKVVGIDLSREMLAEASKKVDTMGLDHVKLLEMDAMNLSFEDDTFDNVFISHVVSVVPDHHRVMREVKRVCKKGGKVVVINHFKSRNKVLAGVEKVITPISEKIGWKSDLCMDEFLSSAGLSVDRVFTLRKVDFWHLIFATNMK